MSPPAPIQGEQCQITRCAKTVAMRGSSTDVHSEMQHVPSVSVAAMTLLPPQRSRWANLLEVIVTKITKDDQFLEQWLSEDELALYQRLMFLSDYSSRVTLESLEALAEARASISRREATAAARDKQIRELREQCQQTDITQLPEWPRMVRAIRTYYAEDMESSKRPGMGAFAVECADDFAAAAMDVIGPTAHVRETE